MAIELLVQPQDPPISGDYTKDVALSIAHNIPTKSILTLWEDTVSTPAVKLGSYITHAANIFQVKSGDEAISGTLSSGINYIEATETSGVITLAWVTSTTGYSYNPAHAGIYNGAGKQLLRDVCYVDGPDNIRGFANGMGFESYTLANGTIESSFNSIQVSGTIQAGSVEEPTGDIEQVGSSLALTAPNHIKMTALTNSLIAYIDETGNLQAYSWNGSTWSAEGSPLTLFVGAITALNSTDVAYYDSTKIRTYRFNGSTWSLVGSSLNIDQTINGSAIAALTSNTIVLKRTDIITGLVHNFMEIYTWSGSAWSLTYSTLISTDVIWTVESIAAISTTRFIIHNSTDGLLQMYTWDGSSISTYGTDFSASTSIGGLTVLSNTKIAYINSSGSIYILELKGGILTEYSSTSLSTTSDPCIIALAPTKIVLADETNASIRTYDRTFESKPPSPVFTL